jgi:DNA-binding SARP family transcriptional activator
MWFGVLGPLLVRNGDAVVTVPAARHRALLAALLLHAGTTVSADTLAEIVWDGAPPPRAEVTLRSHVSRLRQVLGPDVRERVVTQYRGYLIQAGEEEVDLLRFRRLCREGGTAARNGEWAQAWESLDEALGLWRGTPLDDITCELLHRDELPGLEELRLQALEWRADAGLGLGRHGELAAELLPLTVAHPLRERFYAQLMLAQYRCGRQAEALATYASARQVLAEALGTDPGTELRDIHQRILTADPSLNLPVNPGSTSSPSHSQPAVSGQSEGSDPPAEAPRRETAGRMRDDRGPRWLLRSRAAQAVAAIAIAASTAVITYAVSGSGHATNSAAANGSWQCGPFMHVTLEGGSTVNQSLQACIDSDDGHLKLKGVLQGSVDAWKEQITLILKHPRQPTYERLVSPVCTTSTCTYQVPVNPGHGSWWVIPQWQIKGGYQSTGQPSPTVTSLASWGGRPPGERLLAG